MTTAAEITSIEVVFSRGSFQEWTEANGETYPQAFIDAWEVEYSELLERKLQAEFPNAGIEVGEGTEQLMKTQISIDGPGLYEGTEVEDWVGVIESMLDVNDQIDELWRMPSLDTIMTAIIDAVAERPIAKLSVWGATFAFARVGNKDDVAWMDLDIDNPFDGDWCVGTYTDAAAAFLHEVDEDFKLITQREAALIVGVTTQAVNNAIRDGRLRAYTRGIAHRPGDRRVSEADVRALWAVTEEG